MLHKDVVQFALAKGSRDERDLSSGNSSAEFCCLLLSTHVDTLIWYCNMTAFYVLLCVYIYIYIDVHILYIHMCCIYIYNIICTNLYVNTYITLHYITCWHDMTWHYIHIYIYIYLYTSISYVSHTYLCLLFLWYLYLFVCLHACVCGSLCCLHFHASP